MSVLVKNMTFPDMCAYCDFCGGLIFPGGIYTCDCPVDGIHGANITQYIEDDCRHPDCPLVDAPTPHGRLIDADALIANHFSDEHRIALSYANKVWMRKIINDEPTVIEAEVEP